MPFVTVRILKGQHQMTLDKLSSSITKTINQETGIPSENIWVVVEEIEDSHWYANGASVRSSS